MTPPVLLALAALLGYLVGSVPFGYLVARWRGVDITKVGSGNIGATNVGRVLGRKFGVLVFALDFAKGALPVLAAMRAGPAIGDGLSAESAGVAAGLGAFLGHLFPVYLGLRGGRGVATGAGVVAVLLPGPTLVALAAWVLVAVATRYVSAASVTAAAALCAARLAGGAAAWQGPAGAVTAFCLVAAGLVVVRHRENIGRLLRGTENRLTDTPAMFQTAKVLHVLAVGLWFGAAVFFTFVVGPSLFATFEEWSVRQDRPLWLPLPAEYDRPPPGPRFPDPLRKEQGSRVAGAAVGPMFDWYFGLQAICGAVAVVTALAWAGRGRVHCARAAVLVAALATVGIGWWLEREVSALRQPRNEWTDAVLRSAEPDAAAVAAAEAARAAFGRWHVYSLLLNMLTVGLVTAAMALTAALPQATPLAGDGRQLPGEERSGN